MNSLKSKYRKALVAWSILTFMLCLSSTHAQPSERALVYNPSLGWHVDHARTLQQNVLKLYIKEKGSITFCDFASLTNVTVDSIAVSACNELRLGHLSSSDSCFTYTSDGNGTGIDVLCLSICDTNDVCMELEVRATVAATVGLPIVDDFSHTGPAPDSNLWLDQDVFINQTLAYQPLSIGIATFDGLDGQGAPYPGGPAFADALTSAFVDLSSTGEPIYLSFYIQPKGLGLIPKERDSLVVDFKNPNQTWTRVWAHEGLPDGFAAGKNPPPFAYHRIEITPPFLHEAFQFRFRNKAKNEGLQELWHVDYVRLGNNDITREVFRDIAFSRPPKPVLDPYTSMPSSHFIPEETRRNVISSLYNFDQFNVGMNDPTITVSHQGAILMSRTFIEPVSKWTLEPGAITFDFDLNDGGSMNYETLQDGLVDIIQPGDNYQISTQLTFSRGDEIIGAQRNNTVTRVTSFDNYFAYDDGTAESAIIDRGTGSQRTTIAIEFHANTDDRLQGVQFMFPHIEGDISSQRFNLMVWIDSLDEEPEYMLTSVKPYYPDQFFDTLQGYTTYALRDTNDEKTFLAIPSGKFYIGYEQVDLSGVKISVGFDLNSSDGTDFFYFNVGDGWNLVGNSGVLRQGALMLRPVMGNEPVIPTSIGETPISQVQIFPNPSSGLVHLQPSLSNPANWRLSVFDMSGRIIVSRKFTSTLDLTAHPPGPYFLLLRNHISGQQIFSKIVLSR